MADIMYPFFPHPTYGCGNWKHICQDLAPIPGHKHQISIGFSSAVIDKSLVDLNSDLLLSWWYCSACTCTAVAATMPLFCVSSLVTEAMHGSLEERAQTFAFHEQILDHTSRSYKNPFPESWPPAPTISRRNQRRRVPSPREVSSLRGLH